AHHRLDDRIDLLLVERAPAPTAPTRRWRARPAARAAPVAAGHAHLGAVVGDLLPIVPGPRAEPAGV
ncbi:hypothetical protein PJN22_29545, partial [Mycobacterium kansasii]